jgi:hypothetical protein
MTSIGTPEVDRKSVVLVYDAQNGEIVHYHEFITLKGGRHPDQKTMEKEALEGHRQARPEAKGATAFLHLEPSALKAEKAYKVDVAKRALVEQHPRRAAR